MKESPGSSGMRLVIGYAECVAFPEWGIEALPAKIDTGARTSALHVSEMELCGEDRVRFRIALVRDGARCSVPVETDVIRRTRVRSSTGHAEERLVVATRIRLGPVEKEIEVTLTSRPDLRYRMLMGRTALKGNFLVDVAHRYTTGRPPRTKGKRRKKKVPGTRKARRSSAAEEEATS